VDASKYTQIHKETSVFSYSETPQSIGKVLDSMFRLFGATFWKVVWISLFAALISNLPSFFMPDVPQDDPQAALAAMKQVIWFLPLTMAGTLFAYAAIFHRMHGLATGADTGLGDALRVGLAKLLPLIGASILYALALVLGLVALIIPGLLFGLSLYFYMPLIVVDNEGFLSALKISHRLVWRNWWRTATVFVVPMFILMAFYGILGLVGALVGVGTAIRGGGEAELQSTLETVSLFTTFFAVIFGAAIGPLFASLMLVQLHDLKLRREGSDLEARLAG
jgi:hypothetical protein